jgi:hypothetical protein
MYFLVCRPRTNRIINSFNFIRTSGVLTELQPKIETIFVAHVTIYSVVFPFDCSLFRQTLRFVLTDYGHYSEVTELLAPFEDRMSSARL